MSWDEGLVLHEGDTDWHLWDESVYGERPHAAAPAPIEAGEREALEEARKRHTSDEGVGSEDWCYEDAMRRGFIEGAEWQARRAPIEDAEPVAYLARTLDGTYFGLYLASVITDEDREGFILAPLYRHPAAPIEVTEEMVLVALNEHYGEDFGGLDGWTEESQINMRAALEAAFKEMNR